MLERLESRVLLSGNVIATVVKGNLVVRGDGDGNQLVIRLGDVGAVEGAVPSVVVVGTEGTTVNGDSAEVMFPELSRDVRVKLAGGDDRLTVLGSSPGRDLALDLGRGADTLTLDGASVGRNLSVRGADGPKALDLRRVAGAGRTMLVTGPDADTVNFAGSTFTGKAAIKTGAGDDAITGAAAFATGRSINDGPGEDAVTLAEGVTRTFDFRNGDEGWVAGFADYDPENEPFMNFMFGARPLPPDLAGGDTEFLDAGFLLNGLNLSDDLFMFLKRRLGPADGVVPGQAYRLHYTLTFASNAPSNAAGGGGSPGESVHLKAGGSAVEPLPVLDEVGDVRLNVDKGNQSTSGPAASVIGGVGNGLALIEGDQVIPFVSLTRRHVHTSPVTADETGALWLLVGTDSGFEGGTTLYYQRIEVSLVPIDAGTAV